MTEFKPNPLFHETIAGKGEMSFLMEVPNYPVVVPSVQDYGYDRRVVHIQGGVLTSGGSNEQPWTLKVRHDKYKDDEGYKIYIAWYEFVCFQMVSAWDNRINFSGLLVKMEGWNGKEPENNEYGEYPYSPPTLPMSKYLPVPVNLAMYPRKWDK